MAKKGGEMSTSSERGVEMVSPAPSLMLSKTNYRVWAMRMEVFLDSHELWQAIVSENVLKKKDHLTLSVIFEAVRRR
ncbi:unnamed protein product [Spirodela intermedia]|uniref:Uncharacterized protein n=2 Tax=Spirodela intermedia TaxID=51605 RepID=A0ABN7EEI0_SPIIN|nr:unnamed protein product [Spirodela intermedia]CAA7407489.1 unnamed protein product [Spirodela intermedia]